MPPSLLVLDVGLLSITSLLRDRCFRFGILLELFSCSGLQGINGDE